MHGAKSVGLVMAVLLWAVTSDGRTWIAAGAGTDFDQTQPGAGLPITAPSVVRRAGEILSRMTIEEKFYQLFAPCEDVVGKGLGGEQGLFGIASAARSGDARASARQINSWQRYFRDKTRLGIPIIVIDEALHGLCGREATSFPQAIALAATWDPKLMDQVATAIAGETRSRGIRQVLSPVVNIARDPRWGRTEETYGEDPYLASRMAVAFTRAFTRAGVITTPKHFVANSGAGGRDSWPVHLSERALLETDLPPFQACLGEGGALAVMAAYNSLDGVPCCTNHWLLTDLLRGRWGFEGFVISDANAVGGILDLHHTAATREEAGAQAFAAGLDVLLQTELAHAAPYLRAVREGRVRREILDRAVGRVLRAKLALGLFEDPFVDPEEAARAARSAAHLELARRAAVASFVLLENGKGVLPLARDLSSIAVIGPEAAEARLGGYSGIDVPAVSLLDGIRAKLGSGVVVRSAPGCRRIERSRPPFSPHVPPGSPGHHDSITDAADLAAASDVAIVAVGIEEGEFRDRSSLALPGRQVELIHAVAETGTPVVVVCVGGSAILVEDWIDQVDAVLLAWYPGEQGGLALADVLFGDADPGGRLPIAFPRREGQLPRSYRHLPSGRGEDYLDSPGGPRFSFGHGLSYTRFELADLQLSAPKITRDESLHVRLRVRNVGERRGSEVVQLYLHDEVARVARPELELVRFAKVTLEAGEERAIEFTLTRDDLTFLDETLRPIEEPGVVQLLVGASSTDIRLRGRLELLPAPDGE